MNTRWTTAEASYLPRRHRDDKNGQKRSYERREREKKGEELGRIGLRAVLYPAVFTD